MQEFFVSICSSCKPLLSLTDWQVLFFLDISHQRYRLTRIAVDNEAGPHKNHTVVFLGSEKGIILKFLAKMNKGFLNDSLFLEELNVYNPDKYDIFMKYDALGLNMHEWQRWMESHLSLSMCDFFFLRVFNQLSIQPTL